MENQLEPLREPYEPALRPHPDAPVEALAGLGESEYEPIFANPDWK
jgi:hypothetical protein